MMEFTSAQLIGFAETIISTAKKYPDSLPAQADKCLAEIALATLRAPEESPCKYCGGSGYFRWQQSANMCPCPCLGWTEHANGGE